MKRWFLFLVLLTGLCLPSQWPVLEQDGGQWFMTAQAKQKKTKKQQNRSKRKGSKSKQFRRSGNQKPNKQPQSKPTSQAVPLIGASNLVSNQAGNPLLRVNTPVNMTNATVNYKAITVYFNRLLRIPNCVAYELTNTMVAMSDAPGAEKRKNHKFNADRNVAGSPDWGDYRKSGYTRGHMAPAMDMRWDRQAMEQCFLMTNMCPQDEKLNNGAWRELEEKIHRWAKRDGRLIVLTGPIVAPSHSSIGPKHDIAVPKAFYKVIYAPAQERAIAFIYDNCPPSGGLQRHAVTIDEVERCTGLDFFTALGRETERKIEAQCNFDQWK